MLLEDVFKVLALLMPKSFINQFVFVWGCEQCVATMGQFTHINYHYINDLDQIHFACKGLPYEDRDQTLFIDNEPSKAIQNPN
jgi:hypothetical protein